MSRAARVHRLPVLLVVIAAIVAAVRSRTRTKPMMVLGRTTKGKGVSYMENVPIWHYRSPSPEEYQIALKELSSGCA